MAYFPVSSGLQNERRGRDAAGQLEAAYDMGKSKGLKYVYIGNMPGANQQHTICPGCGESLINRSGFSSSRPSIRDGKCEFCGEPIAGIEMG